MSCDRFLTCFAEDVIAETFFFDIDILPLLSDCYLYNCLFCAVFIGFVYLPADSGTCESLIAGLSLALLEAIDGLGSGIEGAGCKFKVFSGLISN